MRSAVKPAFALLFVVAACTGGGDSSTGTTGGSSGASSSGSGSDVRAPGESCVISQDAGSTTFSSRVCDVNPALTGCRMCLELESGSEVCLYACHVGGSDCPAGQTCNASPGKSSDTQGACDGLGYCK
jgi:hypothetical protein